MPTASDGLVEWLVSQLVKHMTRVGRQAVGPAASRASEPLGSVRSPRHAQIPWGGMQNEVSAAVVLTP